MSVTAAIVQFLGPGGETPGASEAQLGVSYCLFDDGSPVTREVQVYPVAGLTYANRGTWKDLMVQAVIDSAATLGHTLMAANVNWPALEPGDYKIASLEAGWTKDITKTNIGTSQVNVYVGAGGEGQLVQFSRWRQYRLVVHLNKVGTGTVTSRLVDVTNAANVLSVDYSGAAGEATVDSGWTDLPAWATGEQIVKPMAFSSVATDDPIFRQLALYLR